MPDKCAVSPDRDCPNATKIALLEQRVENLEEGQERETKFRKDYYEEREHRMVWEAETKSKLTSIDGKLDTVMAYQTEQQKKPGSLLDTLKANAVNYIMLALIGILLFKIGLSA